MASRTHSSGSSGRQSAEVRIERLVAGGDGMGRLDDGRVVFVPGALAGEVVQVHLTQQRRDFARGELVDVIEAAAGRVVPPCPELARGCGGCDWQHLVADGQLAAKVAIVQEALRRTAKLADAHVVAGGSVPPWRYRTSLRLAASPDGRLGLRRSRSHDVVPLGSCAVAHPELEALAVAGRAAGADEVSLRVSASTGQRTAWVSWGSAGTSRASASFPDDVVVGPDAAVHEVVAGVELHVSAASFFQSGPAAAELLVDVVRRAGGDQLAAARTVVDAYAGVGLFAATVVPSSARVVLVESSSSACSDARRNLTRGATEVVEQPVERWAPIAADVVIADPARTGLGAEAAAVLAATDAEVVVLVSCDPVAAARDVRLLVGHGYRLESCTVLDLFPQTHHVETVARLVRV
jgi:23S rRNA (uracil1939-C5)-methyltransferase